MPGTTRIVIVGAGGHGKVVLEMLRPKPDCEVVGLLDDDPAKSGSLVLGVPVLGGVGLLEDLRERAETAVVALGENRLRREVFMRARSGGYQLARVIHPSAIVSPSARVGEGSVIMAGVVVNAEAVIGGNVILNTSCSVDHDCLVGDHSHIAPGAHLGGDIRIGEGALIGLGASILPGVTVGEWAVVGGGAVVTRAVSPRSRVAGVPARELKGR